MPCNSLLFLTSRTVILGSIFLSRLLLFLSLVLASRAFLPLIAPSPDNGVKSASLLDVSFCPPL
ncbi:MAG: hypothetical protein B6229_10430 [Spirochaetaceae bacterium 4572_7]|nr:MAG: hypothetical protein B6229_10430 [Spirochaetaceae bacterium 4572_7]